MCKSKPLYIKVAQMNGRNIVELKNSALLRLFFFLHAGKGKERYIKLTKSNCEILIENHPHFCKVSDMDG